MSDSPEHWKPIPDFPGYEVSDQGHVRSLRILKPGIQTSGYYVVGLRGTSGKPQSKLVHQLVLTAFAGPCPNGQECCHNDSDRTNNRLENLRYDTPSGNHRDIDRKSFISATRSRLDDDTVIAIRQERAAGVSVSHIAEKHNVTKQQVYGICTGKRYGQLGGPRTHGRVHNRNLVTYEDLQTPRAESRLIDTPADYKA